MVKRIFLISILYSGPVFGQIPDADEVGLYVSEPFHDDQPYIALRLEPGNGASLETNLVISGDQDRLRYSRNGSKITFEDDPTFPIDQRYGEARTPFASCNLVEDPSNIFHQRYLECESFSQGPAVRLWRFDSRPQPGSAATIEGVPVFLLGGRTAVTTEKVMFRSFPSTNAPTIELVDRHPRCCTEPPPTILPAIPKGRRLFLVGKTWDEVNVGRWKNRWYYVLIFHEYGITYRTGWVFGEFLKLN